MNNDDIDVIGLVGTTSCHHDGVMYVSLCMRRVYSEHVGSILGDASKMDFYLWRGNSSSRGT